MIPGVMVARPALQGMRGGAWRFGIGRPAFPRHGRPFPARRSAAIALLPRLRPVPGTVAGLGRSIAVGQVIQSVR